MNMDRLTGTHWELKKLNGYEATIERAPTLSFTKDRMNGFNGCNRIFSNYAAGDDGTVSFGHLGSTRMACRNAAGDLEKAVNQTLAATQLFAVSRDGLNLMDSERNILMILSPKAAE